MINLTPGKLGSISGVLASGLLLVSIPILLALKPAEPPPFGFPSAYVLQRLDSDQVGFWTAQHAIYAAFFLLLIPTLFALYQRLSPGNPPLALLGLVAGGLALLSSALEHLWHATMERSLVKTYLTSPWEGQDAMLSLAQSLQRYPNLFHLGASLILVWVLTTVILAHKGRDLPAWITWLSLLLIPALAFFPLAAVVWLFPTVVVLWGEKEPSHRPRVPARARRS